MPHRTPKSIRRFLAILTCLLGSSSLSSPARAYEDGDCARQETVPVSVEESYGVWSETDAARKRALDRTSQQAVARVVGVEVKSIRENKAEIVNDDAEQSFRQLEQSNLSGFVRINILEENRKAAEAGSGGLLSIKSDVTVCVPKSRAVRKEEEERADREKRPPKAVDPTTAAWFDPVSGRPQVWYWREGNRYEFFDNSGFHPRTGDRLTVVDRKVVGEWRAAGEREKREAVERVQREAALKEAEAQRQLKLARAGQLCDELAAGPYDLDRSRAVPGVPLESLKGNAAAAAEACEMAVRQQPDERRYRYQLARAYQATDPKRAMPILQGLMRQNYRASYDNYGWALLDTRVGRNDLRGALDSFRRGAAVGDPDALNSLALMTAKGHGGAGPDEALRLYRRAAALGHREAGEAVERAQEGQRQALQQRQQNDAAARAFMGLIGGALGAAVRR